MERYIKEDVSFLLKISTNSTIVFFRLMKFQVNLLLLQRADIDLHLFVKCLTNQNLFISTQFKNDKATLSLPPQPYCCCYQLLHIHL